MKIRIIILTTLLAAFVAPSSASAHNDRTWYWSTAAAEYTLNELSFTHAPGCHGTGRSIRLANGRRGYKHFGCVYQDLDGGYDVYIRLHVLGKRGWTHSDLEILP